MLLFWERFLLFLGLGEAMKTPEQKARDLLERMEVPGAQQCTAGELVELANLFCGSNTVERECIASISLRDEDEYKTLLNALNQYGHQCLEVWEYTLLKGTRKPNGREFTKQDTKDVKHRSDVCFEMQKRLQDGKLCRRIEP